MNGTAPGRFPFVQVAKYPHMKPEDVLVWDRFVAMHPGRFDTVDYDIALGVGAPTRPEDPENIQSMHTILSQKKVDVVAYKGYTTYVIEVKPIANARALGQILTYLQLYKQDHPLEPNIIPMIVCGEVEREMEGVFDTHGIVVETA